MRINVRVNSKSKKRKDEFLLHGVVEIKQLTCTTASSARNNAYINEGHHSVIARLSLGNLSSIGLVYQESNQITILFAKHRHRHLRTSTYTT